MTQPTFLNKIPKEYILFSRYSKDGVIKKEMDGRTINKGLTLEQVKKIRKEDQMIAVMYYLKDTKYVVLDIDTDKYSIEQLYLDTGIESCFVKGNTKGFHVYMEIEGDKFEVFKKNKVNCGVHCEMDFLGEKVMETINKDWNGASEPAFLSGEQFKKCFNKELFVDKEKTIQPVMGVPDITKPELKKIVSLINPEYCDTFESWRSIVLAMKKCGMTPEEASEWSKQSPKYDDKAFVNLWEQYTDLEMIQPTEGTLRYYAKISNKEEYLKMTGFTLIQLDDMEKGPRFVAERIHTTLKNCIVFCDKKWWVCNNKTHLWEQVKNPTYQIISEIHRRLDQALKITAELLEATPNNEVNDMVREKLIKKQMAFLKYYDKCDSPGFTSQISTHLSHLLTDDTFLNKLDANKDTIAYEDGLLFLKTMNFKKGLKREYLLTKTLPFPFEMPSDEDIQFVRDTIFKICNCNKEHLEYYLQTLGQAMTGDAQLEKALYFCIGIGGDNGKTLIFDALLNIMPNYVYKIDRQTFEKGYSKRHKHLSKVRGKRIVFLEELSNKKQDIELWKEVADGKSITNEIMFGTDENIPLNCKFFTLGNVIPNMDADGGIANRFRQLAFNSNFSKNNTEDDYNNLTFIQDKFLADKLTGKYKHALTYLLFQYANKYYSLERIDMPQEFKEVTEDTLNQCDEFKIFFDDNFEIGEGFCCGKREMENLIKKPLREINAELMRIGKYKYEKAKRFNGERGGWAGFRILTDSIE